MKRAALTLLLVAALGCQARARVAPATDAPVPPAPHGSDAKVPTLDAPRGDASAIDASCGELRFVLDRPRAPDVMLVVDRSDSMNDPLDATSLLTKWNVVKSALELAVGTVGDRLQLGLQLLPAGPTCITGTHAVEPGALDLAGLRSRLDERPYGPSPVRDALDAARLYLGARDDGRDKVIVLVTDGEPGCGRDPALDTTTPPGCGCPGGLVARGAACCIDGRGPESPAPLCMACLASSPTVRDRAGATAAARRIVEDGMRLYVVGVAISRAAEAVLGDIAAAGGSERALPADSAEAVLGALAAVAARESSCTFDLPAPPPDPARVLVTIDGQAVPASSDQGFTFASDGRSLVLHGAACARVRVPARVEVAISYGCADVR